MLLSCAPFLLRCSFCVVSRLLVEAWRDLAEQMVDKFSMNKTDVDVRTCVFALTSCT